MNYNQYLSVLFVLYVTFLSIYMIIQSFTYRFRIYVDELYFLSLVVLISMRMYLKIERSSNLIKGYKKAGTR